MVRLSREIVIYLAAEFGTSEVLRRLSDGSFTPASSRRPSPRGLRR
jgi:hypothetical protein